MATPSADKQLRDRVHDELAWDYLIDESQIEVEVTNQVVTLMGTVGSYAEKVIAQNAASSVKGVHDLINAVDVKPVADMQPSDEDLYRIVEQVLTWDALVPESNIVVSVVDGLVALTGTCATKAQAMEAERAVSHLGGVRDILNRIDVAMPSPSPDDVRTAINEALHRRATHQASHIHVAVDGSTVTLIGTVQSAQERRAVIGAVGHAPGISEVVDRLQIEQPR
jgi:osmotically-inducible protein OsmY